MFLHLRGATVSDYLQNKPFLKAIHHAGFCLGELAYRRENHISLSFNFANMCYFGLGYINPNKTHSSLCLQCNVKMPQSMGKGDDIIHIYFTQSKTVGYDCFVSSRH